jgi:hypothetical protein
MAYIGQEPGQGQAERFIFTASGAETVVSTADDGRVIGYTVGQVSVYLNGVKLVVGTDCVATNGSTITGLSALSASDVVEVIALSAFSPSDTVSASGGTFTGAVTASAGVIGDLTGNASGTAATVTTAAQPAITSVGTLTGFTSTGIDDNATSNAITINSDETVLFANSVSTSKSGVNLLKVENTANDAAGIQLHSGHGNWAIKNSATVADALEFIDESNSNATNMIITNAGKVGIGTAAPVSTLDAHGDFTYGSSPKVYNFSRYKTSGTHNIVTLVAASGSAAICVAEVTYSSLYAYTGSHGGVETEILGTKVTNSGSWSTDKVGLGSAGNYLQDFNWSGGVLSIVVGSSNQVSFNVNLTISGFQSVTIH